MPALLEAAPLTWPDVAMAAILFFGSVAVIWIFARGFD